VVSTWSSRQKNLFKIQFKDETIFDLNVRKHYKNQEIGKNIKPLALPLNLG